MSKNQKKYLVQAMFTGNDIWRIDRACRGRAYYRSRAAFVRDAVLAALAELERDEPERDDRLQTGPTDDRLQTGSREDRPQTGPNPASFPSGLQPTG
jgi:hypothetical protein